MEISGAFSYLLFLLLVDTALSCTAKYNPRITEAIESCENFENRVLDCSGLVFGSEVDEDGEVYPKLSGIVRTYDEITSEFEIQIDVWKTLDLAGAEEYMYYTKANFCSSLDNSDAPWFPVMQSMNVSSCPVASSDFPVMEITISLDCLKDVLCHDFCGEYRVEMSIMDDTTKISCHTLQICIVEEACEE